MPDEQNDQQQAAPPEDFSAYEQWRNNPEKEPEEVEEPSAADSDEEPAESASESETDEEAEQEEQEQAEEEQPKKKGGFQRRIDRLTREKAELADRLSRIEQDLAQRAAKPADEKREEPKQPAANDGKPTPENFKTWEEYTEALTDWKLDQREKAKKADEEKRTSEEQRKAAQSRWNEQVEKGRDEFDDFDEVVVQSKRPASAVVQQFILKSDVGYRVAHELGRDAGLLDKINRLDPIDAVRELSKIEAKHTAAQKAPEEKPKVTKAPKPVKPVTGKVKTAPRIDDPNLEFRDYERLRRKQLENRR
jgi:hypothetical protein